MKSKYLLPILLSLFLSSCAKNDLNTVPAVLVRLDTPIVSFDEQNKTISWDKVENANNYKIYDKYNFVCDINSTSYTIPNFDSEKHEFYVTAEDTTGYRKESDYSKKVSFVSCVGKLDTPLLRYNTISIRFEWDSVEHADYYEIYDRGELIYYVTFPMYQMNKTYFTSHVITVVAKDSSGQYAPSDFSNAISCQQSN